MSAQDKRTLDVAIGIVIEIVIIAAGILWFAGLVDRVTTG